MRNVVIIIPAYKPGESLVRLVRELNATGFQQIIAVDDGSGAEYAEIFQNAEQEGCTVARHEENRGKGAALKTGIRKAIECCGSGNSYITADSDGQHLPQDILRIAEEAEQHPNALVLGTRDLRSKNVPFRSRLGNSFSSLFFKLTNGISCPDTQTGLRGIPPTLEELALSEEGDRYEYEMNFLSDAARTVELKFVPIQTVYNDKNSSSHFRPIVDSIRVYGRFLRFVSASLIGAASDYLLFWLLSSVLPLPKTQMIFLATALARIGSGFVNYLLNRYFSFHSKKPVGGEILRYGILFVCQMAASAGLVALISMLPIPVIVVKLVVDTCLFFISYIIQKNWVFRKGVD